MIRLEWKEVDGLHIITSPDVCIFVARKDVAKAFAEVPVAVATLARMKAKPAPDIQKSDKVRD